jgi:type III pantothenate kinase
VFILILCDIGNTTFHFLINGKHKKYSLKEEVPFFKNDICYVSVNEKATKKLLSVNPHAKDITQFLKFETEYVGLGVDREVACAFEKDSIIVDAGSAITVDIMKNSKHKGGFILPGISAFIKTYPKISKKLKFDFEKDVNLDKIPLQTKDAIQYAMMKSIILPIKEVAKNKNIIFTGGDGKLLSGYFKNSVYKKDLIFENMKRIIDANNCIA